MRRLAMLPVVLAFMLSASVVESAPVQPAGLSADERDVVNRVSERSIREATTVLASDRMEGRGTLQPGGQRAAEWIAARMKALGLAPGGDSSSYFQHVPLRATEFVPPTHVSAGGAWDLTIPTVDAATGQPARIDEQCGRLPRGRLAPVGPSTTVPVARVWHLGARHVQLSHWHGGSFHFASRTTLWHEIGAVE